MSDIKPIVKLATDKYAQCNFCHSKSNLFTIQGEGLSLVITICEECIKELNNQ